MSLDDAIAAICNRVEAVAPHSRTGVSIASSDRSRLSRAVFPNLPKTFQLAIKDLPMGAPYFGACTAAMDGDLVVTSSNIAEDCRFDRRFVRLCVDHGIYSLQSRPVYGREKRPIGTFVMGYDQPREDRDFDVALMDFAADAVGTLLQNELDADR